MSPAPARARALCPPPPPPPVWKRKQKIKGRWRGLRVRGEGFGSIPTDPGGDCLPSIALFTWINSGTVCGPPPPALARPGPGSGGNCTPRQDPNGCLWEARAPRSWRGRPAPPERSAPGRAARLAVGARLGRAGESRPAPLLTAALPRPAASAVLRPARAHGMLAGTPLEAGEWHACCPPVSAALRRGPERTRGSASLHVRVRAFVGWQAEGCTLVSEIESRPAGANARPLRERLGRGAGPEVTGRGAQPPEGRGETRLLTCGGLGCKLASPALPCSVPPSRPSGAGLRVQKRASPSGLGPPGPQVWREGPGGAAAARRGAPGDAGRGPLHLFWRAALWKIQGDRDRAQRTGGSAWPCPPRWW